MLIHHVYFTLHDSSPAGRKKLVDACNKYLTNHPGLKFFGCGTLADGYERSVNDRNFDVALAMAFETREAHDAYQVAERHNQFIAENKDDWKQVRVFDFEA